jgi:5-formyltetrahydrofolate cyclo-ligase
MTSKPDADNDETASGEYASPPCYMHEVDPAYSGLDTLPDLQQQCDVRRWRKAERERLIAARLSMAADERRAADQRIVAALDALLASVPGEVVAAYWPVNGEPDLRDWMAGLAARGRGCALPVAIGPDAPLIFREWRPGAPLAVDVMGVPAPLLSAALSPDIVIAPALGFDAARHRLGYGGGLLDRTLAAMTPRPRAIGVAYAHAALPTIYPQPHDIAMDVIATENGCFLT